MFFYDAGGLERELTGLAGISVDVDDGILNGEASGFSAVLDSSPIFPCVSVFAPISHPGG